MNTEQIIKALEHWAKNFDGKVKDLVTLCEAVNLIKELQAHNENLKKENKYLRERMDEETEHAKDLAISDTVKKMQEKVYEVAQDIDEVDAYFLKEMIDQIAKEILEGNHEV